MLPDLDSNQDKQNQNLSYYHYTIGQPVPRRGCKNKAKQYSYKKIKRFLPAVGRQIVGADDAP